jgi:hypothetical protein
MYRSRSVVVVLDVDVAAVFPSAGEVNQALCALAEVILRSRPRRVCGVKKKMEPSLPTVQSFQAGPQTVQRRKARPTRKGRRLIIG